MEEEKVTYQRAFDDVCRKWVIGDEERALRGAWCAYRTEDGRGCAIGQYIPEGLYHKSIEAVGVVALFRTCPDIADLFVNPASQFWDDLQQIHDSRVKSTRKILAIELAAYYNLILPAGLQSE